MRRLLQILLLGSVLTLGASSCFSGQPQGEREGLRLVAAFPDHPRWRRPLWFGALPGPGGLHAVAEQHGVVRAFVLGEDGSASEPWVLLDVSERTARDANERGFLGLAFHPGFAQNRRMFVHYSVEGNGRGRLSEFRVEATERPVAVAGSERVLLEVAQPYGNHNGGHLEFGPDGMLYMGLGDGGSAGDPQENGQDTGTLLGSILRLDVDRVPDGAAYGVPPDNPFVNRAGARGELWAIGLRNPWRFAFDPDTGLLWVGDVGQTKEEEIAVVERGSNQGWKLREGFAPYEPGAPAGPGEPVEPVVTYLRNQGWSVTGGRVYRGRRLPALWGRYVYADYVSGFVWAIEADPAAPGEPVCLFEVDGPSSFGEDAWGELYLTSFDGRVYRIAPAGS